jgi:hypothetical protein
MTTTQVLESANEALRTAVESRLGSCCEGQRTVVSASWDNPEAARADAERQLRGMSAAEVVERFSPTHPTSQRFYELCDQLKEMHRRKSRDYGSSEDPLANIRNGAKFVGIEDWRAALVRLSDKVTRLETYCRTGSLTYENFEDTCLDLASYSLLVLLTHRHGAD